jgi:hypothetical protein
LKDVAVVMTLMMGKESSTDNHVLDEISVIRRIYELTLCLRVLNNFEVNLDTDATFTFDLEFIEESVAVETSLLTSTLFLFTFFLR